MKPRVVITHWVHSEVIESLQDTCEVVPNLSRDTLTREEILRRAWDADALMVFMPDRVDDDFLRHCPNLKIIAGALKGYDNFDVEACNRHRVWFTIVQDLLTAPAAELTVGLLISLTRNILPGDRFVRSGNFQGWRPQFYGVGLQGNTVGMIGMGCIGRAIARRLSVFEMETLYTDPTLLSPMEEHELGVKRVPLDELLSQSHFVIVACPLTPETLHLMNTDRIGRMRPGSFLINPSRGSIVDENAVGIALSTRHLAGYAADVYALEDWARPDHPSHIPTSLLEQPDRTLFTPHLGSAVDEIRKEIGLEAARSILAALDGRVPGNAINLRGIVKNKKI
jgi:phosphonate dehydrogenase